VERKEDCRRYLASRYGLNLLGKQRRLVADKMYYRYWRTGVSAVPHVLLCPFQLDCDGGYAYPGSPGESMDFFQPHPRSRLMCCLLRRPLELFYGKSVTSRSTLRSTMPTPISRPRCLTPRSPSPTAWPLPLPAPSPWVSMHWSLA
jgi:hypothetical protein